MRFLLILLLLIPANKLFCNPNLRDLIKQDWDSIMKPYKRNHAWMLDSIILYDRLIQNFRINQNVDTIYILYRDAPDDWRACLIWDNSDSIAINPISIRNSYIGKGSEFTRLIPNWETEILEYLGKYSHETEPAIPERKNFLSRLIVYNGYVTCNSVFYYDFDYDFTDEQLDSIRETLYLAKHTKLIPTSIQLDEGKTVSTQSPNMHSLPKTLWQRIVDWFRNLWHSIFG